MNPCWYQRLSPDGMHVVSINEDAQKTTRLMVNDVILPIRANYAVFDGFGGARVLFTSGAGNGTNRLTLANGEIQEIGGEFNELDGANGSYAGSRAGTLFLSDGRTFPTLEDPGICGDPACAPDGFTVWIHEDPVTKVRTVRSQDGLTYAAGAALREPSVGLSWVVWATGTGEVWGSLRDGSHGPVRLSVVQGEGRPRVIDTTDTGVWLLTMTDTDLLLRLIGRVMGIRRTLGKNRNLQPDGKWRGDGFRIVANADDGTPYDEVIAFSEAQVDLRVTPPPVVVTPPPVVTPDPEEPSVNIPNCFDVVQAVRDAHHELIEQNTRESVTEFMERLGEALVVRDPGFGYVGKSEGENHIVINGQMVAIDAFTYRLGDVTSDKVIDVLSSAGDGPGTGGITWSEDERRPSNLWVRITTGGDDGDGGDENDGQDNPPVPSPAICNCATEISELRSAMELMRQDMLTFQRDYALKSHTHPAPVTLPKLRAKSNGGFLGHTHEIEVVPEVVE